MHEATLQVVTTSRADSLAISSHGNVIALLLQRIDARFAFEHACSIRNPDVLRVTYDGCTLRWDAEFALGRPQYIRHTRCYRIGARKITRRKVGQATANSTRRTVVVQNPSAEGFAGHSYGCTVARRAAGAGCGPPQSGTDGRLLFPDASRSGALQLSTCHAIGHHLSPKH